LPSAWQDPPGCRRGEGLRGSVHPLMWVVWGMCDLASSKYASMHSEHASKDQARDNQHRRGSFWVTKGVSPVGWPHA